MDFISSRGRRELAQGDGGKFSSFIVDRFADSSQAGCTWRYKAITRLVQELEKDGEAAAFGGIDVSLFRAYLAEGMYFRQASVSVAYGNE